MSEQVTTIMAWEKAIYDTIGYYVNLNDVFFVGLAGLLAYILIKGPIFDPSFRRAK